MSPASQPCTVVLCEQRKGQGMSFCHMQHSMRRRVSAETWLEGSSWIGSRRQL